MFSFRSFLLCVAFIGTQTTCAAGVSDGHNAGQSAWLNALENAINNNKDLKALEFDIKALHEELIVARANFLPSADIGAGYDTGRDAQWNSNTAGTTAKDNISKKSIGLTVSQNLFKGGADKGAYDEVSLVIESKWNEFEAASQNVLFEVSNVYAQIIAKTEEQQHLKSLKDSTTSSYEVAREMFESGAAKQVDVLQAEAKVSETVANIAKVESEIISLRAKFEELTGIPAPLKLVYPGNVLKGSNSADKAFATALKVNPSIKAAVLKAEAAKAAVAKANSGLMPIIDLSYNYQQSLDSGSKENSAMSNNARGHKVSLGVKYNLFAGGANVATKRKLKDAASKSAVEKNKLADQIKTAIHSAYADLESAKQRLKSTEIAIKAREEAVANTNEEVKAGTKTMNDLLDEQQKLFEAKKLRVDASREYFVTECRILTLEGAFSASYLGLKNAKRFDYKKDLATTKSASSMFSFK